MRLSIFKRGEILKDKVIFEGEARGTSYFSFKDLYKRCKPCNGTGKTQKIDGLDIGEDLPCTICHGKGKLRERVDITIKSDGKKTFIDSCTCIHCSVHGARSIRCEDRLTLCSYKIAVLKALPI